MCVFLYWFSMIFPNEIDDFRFSGTEQFSACAQVISPLFSKIDFATSILSKSTARSIDVVKTNPSFPFVSKIDFSTIESIEIDASIDRRFRPHLFFHFVFSFLLLLLLFFFSLSPFPRAYSLGTSLNAR